MSWKTAPSKPRYLRGWGGWSHPTKCSESALGPQSPPQLHTTTRKSQPTHLPTSAATLSSWQRCIGTEESIRQPQHIMPGPPRVRAFLDWSVQGFYPKSPWHPSPLRLRGRCQLVLQLSSTFGTRKPLAPKHKNFEFCIYIYIKKKF